MSLLTDAEDAAAARAQQRAAWTDEKIKRLFQGVTEEWARQDQAGDPNRVLMVMDIIGPFLAGMVTALASIGWDSADEGTPVEVVAGGLERSIRQTIEAYARDRPAGLILRLAESQEQQASGRIH